MIKEMNECPNCQNNLDWYWIKYNTKDNTFYCPICQKLIDCNKLKLISSNVAAK
jgi:hypothetical protein